MTNRIQTDDFSMFLLLLTPTNHDSNAISYSIGVETNELTWSISETIRDGNSYDHFLEPLGNLYGKRVYSR